MTGRRNFLTTGVVMSLAWISLAPLSLLFVATITSSSYATEIKIASLLLTLFLWIFLSMGTGFLWKRESQKEMAPSLQKPIPKIPSEPLFEVTPLFKISLETLQAMKEEEFATLCVRIFQKLWPEMAVEKSENPLFPQEWVGRRQKKLYLIHCENQKVFFDSREVRLLGQRMREKNAAGSYFFIAGLFSQAAQEAAKKERVELADGQKTMELLQSFLNEGVPFLTPPQKTERRRHCRFPFEAFPQNHRPTLELGNVYHRTVKTTATLSNISSGGLCIETPFTIELPSFFQIGLKLPPHPDLLYTLSEVVWRSAQQTRQTNRYGISFVSMSDENRERLSHFLEKDLSVQGEPKP